MADHSDLPFVTEPAEEFLNSRQQTDYEEEREACLQWLLSIGKNPERGEGYAFGTVKPRSYRMDQFYRWVWEHEGEYTTNVQTDHAEKWTRYLAQTD
jgi:hypothetical protein